MGRTQFELFDSIQDLACRVDNLKKWIQNDFHKMAAEEGVTKEDLLDSLDDILTDFDEEIEQLNILKLDVWNFVKNVADELEKD